MRELELDKNGHYTKKDKMTRLLDRRGCFINRKLCMKKHYFSCVNSKEQKIGEAITLLVNGAAHFL